LVGVVSFSDPVARATVTGEVVFLGHVGTVYQALNATYLGLGTSRTLRLLPDGRVFSARSEQKIRAQESGCRYATEILLAAGAPEPVRGEDPGAWLRRVLPLVTRKMRHGGNHKYCWALARRDRRYLPASLPYPKLSAPPVRGPLSADLAR
jgi:hypothetical protein